MNIFYGASPLPQGRWPLGRWGNLLRLFIKYPDIIKEANKLRHSTFPLFLQVDMNHVMKRFSKKTGCLFLLLCAGMVVMAQTSSYNILSKELQSLQKQLVPDKRVAILKIEIKDTLQPVVVVVSGETDLPYAKSQIISFLIDKKVPFIDSIRTLPDAKLGDKPWALATLSVSNIRALPDHTSELVSQALMGTPLKVLDFNGKWYRVQTP